MARYSDEIINEIFSQNDIVDYVSQYVKLRKNGRDYTGLCPFHNEKSPSFHVNQEKQLFHCFGCGAGGNLIQFVMRSEGLDFVEALKLMADRAGIILPEDDNSYDDELYQKKKRILAMNKTAARFYYELLTKDEQGEEGRKYFTNRKIDKNTITKYGLGFAPNNFDTLKKYMNKLGFSDDELLESGLCVTKNGKVYDKFRGRVIFPIIDLRGNVIAFGGRIIDNTEIDGYKPPKYLNSSDTPVFNKGRNLFSLNLAKKDADMQCILCEGYLDVISVYKSGVPNIVATLGTALTEDQAKLLLKYTNEILLCYDSDEAGQAATLRAINIINSVGGKCRIMRLKGSKDPDEYINKYGVSAFKDVINNALPSTEYLINRTKQQYNLDMPDGKVMFVEESAKILSKITNEIEIDVYVGKVSDMTGINKDAIYAEINKQKSQGKISNTPTKQISTIKNSVKTENYINIEPEKKLLRLISESKQIYLLVKEDFKPEDFSTKTLSKLASYIYETYERDEPIEPPLIMSKFSGDDIDFVSNILCNREVYEDEKNTVAQLIASVKIEKINSKIEIAKKENDFLKLKELLALKLSMEGNKKDVRFRK